MTTIREMLELGVYYARNKQWNSAAPVFAKALEQIYQNATGALEDLPGSALKPKELKDALEGLDGKPVAVADAHHALAQLRAAHQNVSALQDLTSAAFMSAFRSPAADSWTLVYHDQEKQPEGGGNLGKLVDPIPRGPSFSFVLKITDDVVKSVTLSKTTAAQLTYALSHLAEAKVNEVMGLYRQYQVLTSSATPAIMVAARYYDWALLIKPDNAWALSHSGEVYRDIANSWPDNNESIVNAVARLANYTNAIFRCQQAIEVNPRSSWAHAHLGAAIVNARAFIFDDKAIKVKIGSEPAEIKFDSMWAGLAIHMATEWLTTAQKLVGNYYPWAQAYYADALLIQAALSGRPDVHNKAAMLEKPDVSDLAMEAATHLLEANYLQPSLNFDAFDPGQLYVGGFFEIGRIYFGVGQYSKAWKYLCNGMGRLFQFRFLPGLHALLGYQFLANIGERNILGAEHEHVVAPIPVPKESIKDKDRKQLVAFEAALSYFDSSLIPGELIKDRNQLVEFIRDIFNKSCKPTITPFLEENINLSTSIQMGLIQACSILGDFRRILWCVDPDGSGTILDEIFHYMSLIAEKLYKAGLAIRLSQFSESYGHYLDDAFTFMNTGKVGFYGASCVEAIPLLPNRSS